LEHHVFIFVPFCVNVPKVGEFTRCLLLQHKDGLAPVG